MSRVKVRDFSLHSEEGWGLGPFVSLPESLYDFEMGLKYNRKNVNHHSKHTFPKHRFYREKS